MRPWHRVTCVFVLLWCAAASACRPPPSSGTAADAEVQTDSSAGDEPVSDEVWLPFESTPAAFDFPPWTTLPAPGTVVVGWRSVTLSTGKVRFGTSRNYGQTRTSARVSLVHHVRLENLEPATTYVYEVTIDGADGRVRGQFTTPGGANVRFLHLAEFHAASDAPQVSKFATAIRGFHPHVVIESGDMVNDGNVIDDWRGYMRTSAPWISNVILLPIGSNHVRGDAGNPLFLDFFELPNNERWYRTRFGPVEVLSLDSTFDFQPTTIPIEEPAWVGEQAALAHDGIDDPSFLVGAWHYPACSSRYKSRAALRDWVMNNFISQFMANGGLDLALVGHDKYYERSTIAGSIVHVQTASGRLSPSTAGDNHANCSTEVTRTDTRSVLFVRASDTRLEGRAVDPSGIEVDSFEITR